MKTVKITVRNNLCISCGICKAVCPRGCIEYKRINGMYIPSLNTETCISCGLCADVCPGLRHRYASDIPATNAVSGTAAECHNAWSRDPEIRKVSASGGVVTTIVRALLEKKQYDIVFTLDTYDYRTQLKVQPYTEEQFVCRPTESSTPKSRYLPVSHEETVRYLKENPDSRVIIIGTPCAIRGIRAALAKWKRSTESILFIGLFCDKVFNYNVLSYFNDRYCPKTGIDALHFKNKESGGWPGDMKFYPTEGKPFYRPLAERAAAKAYFMPERCLYCIDKLNVEADISLGDNYTGQDSSLLGSNSVIIRTSKGKEAWSAAEEFLEAHEIGLEAIITAQDIEHRLNNLYFGDLKVADNTDELSDLNIGVRREKNAYDHRPAMERALTRLHAGAVYEQEPEVLRDVLKNEEKAKKRSRSLLRRVYRKFKRIMAKKLQ